MKPAAVVNGGMGGSHTPGVWLCWCDRAARCLFSPRVAEVGQLRWPPSPGQNVGAA